jgi:nucleotide-binding universal stress UspA family protein
VRTEPEDLEDIKRHAQADIQPLLDEAAALIEAAGVPVEATLEWETAHTALLDVARRRRADLIVVGAHGSDATGRAIGRVLLGSTSSRLLHYSDVPVLVVPHGD